MTHAGLLAIFTTLERLAAERPNNVALTSPRGHPVTFGRLNEAIGAAATRLQREGMRPGDFVVFSVRPSVESLILILATVRAGGCIVAADPGMGAELFVARIAPLHPRFVMAESLLYAVSANGPARRLLRLRHLDLPQVGRLPGCRFVRVGRPLPGVPPSIDSAQLMRPLAGPAAPAIELDEEDPVFVVFTSGTTAAPRAVVHTARSVAATLGTSSLISDLDRHAVVMTDQLHSALPACLAGARVVLPRIGAGPKEIVRLLQRSRATHAFFVPSDMQRLVAYCERQSLALPDTLRQIVLGAGPVDRPLLARLRTHIGATTRVLAVYGMTEMAPIACVEIEEKCAWEGDGDLVGTPLPGTHVRIDQTGQLHVGGDWLCGRYLGGEPLTEVATGDLARMEDGRIVLAGRLKDMIVRGRYNIYPALYEDRIAEIPGVARCALIGVWDDRLGDERVILVIEPRARERDPGRLRRRVDHVLHTSAVIDTLALPDDIVVMPLPESGRSNKVDRNSLRQMLAQSTP